MGEGKMLTALSRQPTIGFRVEVVVEPDEKGFHAYCPALKGLHTYGDSQQNALENARDAAMAYLMSLIKHGDPIPLGVMHEHKRDLPSKKQGQVIHHTEDLNVACIT